MSAILIFLFLSSLFRKDLLKEFVLGPPSSALLYASLFALYDEDEEEHGALSLSLSIRDMLTF